MIIRRIEWTVGALFWACMLIHYCLFPYVLHHRHSVRFLLVTDAVWFCACVLRYLLRAARWKAEKELFHR